MANSKRKCKQCSEYHPAESGVKTPGGWFCGIAHAIEFAREKSQRLAERKAKQNTASAKANERSERAAMQERKKELNRPKHLDKLQRLVNQYVVHIRDKDAPCCTCGTTSQSIKYDAGHFRSRGACPELRFELTNIAKQCSVNCNVMKSGSRLEFSEFIRNKYGQEHLDWINGKHKTLKEQMPDAKAIDAEIARYREIIRSNGLKPSV